MNTRNTMTSSYHSKERSTQNNGVTFLLFETWTSPFPHAGMQPEIFQSRRGFVELGHFDKHFVKSTQKKAPLGNIFKYFSPTVKTSFRMKGLIQRWTQSGLFSKIRALFSIFNPPSPHLVAPVLLQ